MAYLVEVDVGGPWLAVDLSRMGVSMGAPARDRYVTRLDPV